MRIISKTHDYYDGASAHGVDQNIVFVRDAVTIKNNEKDHPAFHHHLFLQDKINSIRLVDGYWHRPAFRLLSMDHINERIDGKVYWSHTETLFVLFVGKLYPVVVVKTNTDTKKFESYFYDAATFLSCKYLQSRINARLIKTANAFFDYSYPDLTEFAITNKIAVATIHNGKTVINDTVEQYEFFKMFDAYSAFQELDMFISGTLAYPHNFMIEVGDKSKVKKHGFDEKYGFRTRPQ